VEHDPGTTGSEGESEDGADTSSDNRESDSETEMRREAADALGTGDLYDPRVTAAVTDAQIRASAAAGVADTDASRQVREDLPLSNLSGEERERLVQQMLTNGFKQETVREHDGLTTREVVEFLPSGEGSGHGTYKNTRITEWADGKVQHHEVRVGADGKRTITDLGFEGGDLVTSTRTTLTENGPVTEVLRGGTTPTDKELTDFYGKIGLGSGSAAASNTGVSGSTSGVSGTGGSGESTDTGTDGFGGGGGIRDEIGWGGDSVDSGDGTGDLGPGDGSDIEPPGPVDDANDFGFGGEEPGGDEGGSDIEPPGPVDEPQESFGGSEPGGSTGGGGGQPDVTSPGGTATGLTPGVLGYIWITNDDGTQTAYDPYTGMKVQGQGPDNIIDADTDGGGGSGQTGGSGGDAGTDDSQDTTQDDGETDDEEDDEEEEDEEEEDEEEETERPSEDDGGAVAPDPFGIAASASPDANLGERMSIRYWDDKQPTNNPDDTSGGTGGGTGEPAGGGVTDPAEDDVTEAYARDILAPARAASIRTGSGAGPEYGPDGPITVDTSAPPPTDPNAGGLMPTPDASGAAGAAASAPGTAGGAAPAEGSAAFTAGDLASGLAGGAALQASADAGGAFALGTDDPATFAAGGAAAAGLGDPAAALGAASTIGSVEDAPPPLDAPAGDDPDQGPLGPPGGGGGEG
jgi:hypothetical protein